ncbi:arginine transporter [Pseudoponticoccus marisrubri]|nr:arginine transporter [Pseudoponticoccus marisrubri]
MLAACGGGNRVDRAQGAMAVSFASGPISKACLRAGRKAASGRLCNCVQGVANRAFDGSEQRMAASFFADPHRAQEIRQSDNPGHEVFWRKYKAFAANAERVCRGY